MSHSVSYGISARSAPLDTGSQLEHVVSSVSEQYQAAQSTPHYNITANIGYIAPQASTDNVSYSQVANNSMTYNSNEYNLNHSRTEYFQPKVFLRADRPKSQSIGELREIEPHIRETFQIVTGKELPNDMIINLVSKEKLKEVNNNLGGKWSEGIQ